MRNQLVALAIVFAFPTAGMAASVESGVGLGAEATKESTPPAATSGAGVSGSASGNVSAPETKASGSAQGKAKATVSKPDAGKAPEDMSKGAEPKARD